MDVAPKVASRVLQGFLRNLGSCECGRGPTCSRVIAGPEDTGSPVTVEYASHPLEASQQVLRRLVAPVSLDMAPRPLKTHRGS